MEKSFAFTFETFSSLRELPEEEQLLIQQALDNSRNAYAPYSRFHVGASVKLENGTCIAGNNQENASYPQGLCAERVALFSASANHPGQPIAAIALASADGNGILTPCGACRQVLLEYEQRQGKPIRVLMANSTGEVIVVQSAKDLLPFCCSKDHLQ